jgi:hypothetical protein
VTPSVFNGTHHYICRCSAIEYRKRSNKMRKFLISAALVVSTLGLAACSDNVDENATGSVDNTAPMEQPAAPAAPAEDPAVTPAPVQ